MRQNKHITGTEQLSSRKKDHIDLAFRSQVEQAQLDKRFNYEPMLSGHPMGDLTPYGFLNKIIRTPIWVSSMTGGTEQAYTINTRLAKACNKFGMGMGLGSCRSILDNNDRLKDFDLRKIIGDDLPFYANIGIAQLEKLADENAFDKIDALVDKLAADGIIIHVNPLQEWLQPEGDKITRAPVITIQQFLDFTNQKVIVKEVGQGMGMESLKTLMQMPLEAIEFAAHGGTNFSKLELLRSDEESQGLYGDLTLIGHSATEMVNMANLLLADLGETAKCTQFIISGGVRNFLDGYYLMNRLYATSAFGMASTLLKYAAVSEAALEEFLAKQIEGLKLAQRFLTINE